jgi:hypothetical protein
MAAWRDSLITSGERSGATSQPTINPCDAKNGSTRDPLRLPPPQPMLPAVRQAIIGTRRSFEENRFALSVVKGLGSGNSFIISKLSE